MGRSRLNLGIVGCGDIAGFTALFARLVPRLSLAACCDANPERAQAFAHRHRIPVVHRSFEDLLAQPGLDAVYLAVPHDLHAGMIRAAAGAGLAVLVEKPLTRTLEEGAALCRDLPAGQKVGVNYQYRYDAGCYALARAVQSGALGKAHTVRINIPWRREASYFENSPWHATIARAGGGTLITQGSHLLDVALWALGEKPVSALGFTASPGFAVEVDTLAQGIVQTGGGALVNICSSMVAAREGAVSLEVYGEHGTAIYTNRPWPRVRFEGVSPRRERPPEPGLHALQRSLSAFVCWVLDDRPYLIPMPSALPVLAAVDAIYRSARSGRRETVDLGCEDEQ
jgi:predicted dehydrogenase